MPEYLAPAVYVEEVDTGTKPIEGVSTSTTGMIGVTERGPANVPMLVTSMGEYSRVFGQALNAALYGEHRFLPHAVEGYFGNGGKRLYVSRVLNTGSALPATRLLVAPEAGAPVQARSVLAAAPGATMVILDRDPGFGAGDTVQIDEGRSAEFLQVTAVPTAAAAVTLRQPLDFDHAAGETIEHLPLTDAAPAGNHSSTVSVATTAGSTTVQLANAGAFTPAIVAGDLFRVGTGAEDEELVVAAAPPDGNTVTFRTPLHLAHIAATPVRRLAVGAVIAPTRQIAAGSPVAPGSAVVLVNNTGGLTTEDDAVRFVHADATRVEFRRIGALTRVPLNQGAYAAYPAGTTLQRVTPGAGGAIVALTRAAAVGDAVIEVDNRVGFNPGMLLQIGAGASTEVVEIIDAPSPVAAPNPGLVILRGGLRFVHPIAGNPVQLFPVPTAPTRHSVLALDVGAGDNSLPITRSTFAIGDLLRVTPPGGGPFFHTVGPGASAAIAPVTASLSSALLQSHVAGLLVSRRTPFADIVALDAGQWGDRLQVAMERQDPPLLSTQVRQTLPGGRLRLNSAAGVEIGTELVLVDGGGTVTSVKVANIDRQNDFLITLEATTPLPGGLVAGDAVTTREYRLQLELLRQPDPSNPARDTAAIDREIFSGLSLDRRHSRYFETIIGCTWNMTTPTTVLDDRNHALRRGDRRSEGESAYIRVFDRGHAASTGLRVGPLATYQLRPGSTPKLILLPLSGGNDSLGTINDLTYIGADNIVPEQRTGLFTLRNVEEISIVGAPGRTGVAMQNALINHCELMRYRFAVLDGLPPPTDSLPDIQAQRQQFDTKYAALYHPWLLIPDPFPTGGLVRLDYPVPPTGHMLGIYARTDIERGVHKAPANEVVRGVAGLERVLNKEQHDILNPYPVNVNVIRDFRPNNRGIRVYGGRVITSDSDWKYVNVRRLLIFIEASIDRGLQWVVFEPNAEPLWARVRRSIVNFLTLVWRNGALEGTKPEEAFFVKCDRTTMTQTDIDQGRLICNVGVAPVKPAEFVIVRIGLWTAHADD